MAKRKASDAKAKPADAKPVPAKSARKRKTAAVPDQEAALQDAAVQNGQPVTDEAIRLVAYQKWEAAGRPHGDDARFWQEAMEELTRGK
jgi:hypothetical protein